MTHQTVLLSPIVGMHFRPPAAAVARHLPHQTVLILDPEPGNQYDANAIRVLVEVQAIPEAERAQLAEELGGYGWSLDELFRQSGPLQLGYVAASANQKALNEMPGQLTGNGRVLDMIGTSPDWVATLDFSPRGTPLVKVTSNG